MKSNRAFVGGLVVALLSAAILLFIRHRESKAEAARTQRLAALARTIVKPTEPPAEPAHLPAETSARPLEGKTQSLPETTEENVKTQKVAQIEKAKPKKEKVVQDPLSRVALSLVGVDLDAEMYWFDAIQDPTLPISERQDLIDDLNEEGLPDPKHPTLDDLPLIMSRIEILEALIPFLPDGFEHKEALDDLWNLYDLPNGFGKPVQ